MQIERKVVLGILCTVCSIVKCLPPNEVKSQLLNVFQSFTSQMRVTCKSHGSHREVVVKLLFSRMFD